MSWRGRFWLKADRIAIGNITAYWIAFQALAMFLIWANNSFADKLMLDTAKILQGEWWRLFTFLFAPASTHPVFALFVFYFYWMMGSALEANWGKGKYNVFLLIGAVANIGAAFVPLLAGVTGTGSNYYLMESVFLAFATLYPNFQIYIFFIIPVKVKWLAWLTAILLLFQFVVGGWTEKAMIVMSVANYLVFFRSEIWDMLRFGSKQMRRQVKKMGAMGPETDNTMHRCVICGATERSAPQLEFRYCSLCGGKCYCLEHLRGHNCVPAGQTASKV